MSSLVGLKFPFCVNTKGGVSLNTLTKNDTSLYDGKIEQLLNTNQGERTMECDVFAELDTFVFSSNDASTRTLLEYEIKQAIAKHIPDIVVTSVDVRSVKRAIVATITYTVKAFNTTTTTQVKVGDAS
jgi:phage baseplate assembly protein W